MEGIGWEIRPAGWILLFVVAVVLIYYLIKWLRCAVLRMRIREKLN